MLLHSCFSRFFNAFLPSGLATLIPRSATTSSLAGCDKSYIGIRPCCACWAASSSWPASCEHSHNNVVHKCSRCKTLDNINKRKNTPVFFVYWLFLLLCIHGADICLPQPSEKASRHPRPPALRPQNCRTIHCPNGI